METETDDRLRDSVIRIRGNSCSLGNHKIWPSYGGFAHRFLIPSGMVEAVIVEGTRFELEHVEHGLANVKIPEEHFALVTTQRGGRPSDRAID